MTLLEECIEELGEAVVFDDDKSFKLSDEFQDDFPFTQWGRINWDEFEQKKEIHDLNEVNDFFDSKECYLMWDDGSLPVIKAPLNKVLSVIDDVTAVSFNTWILSDTNRCVVEFFHDGQITVGLK